MSQPFIGPVSYPDLPEQPRFPTWCTEWGAYDVPRLWDIVRYENDSLGWEQVKGFTQLSELLVDQYRRLRTQWTHLSDAWQGPAAQLMLSRLDTFSTALLSDAHCAATTASALNGIMDTYANARLRMGTLADHWNHVTSDWTPEWWDDAAAELNTEAADIMQQTDQAVRDHRSHIIIPRSMDGAIHQMSPEAEDQGAAPDNRAGKVPPVPGYRPTRPSDGSGQWAEVGPEPSDDADLAGMPSITQAVPGQPVSMLPIPAGNEYAPYGGAYILPGPGVGRGGYVVQMPRNGNGSWTTNAWNSQAGAARQGTAGGTSVMPVATGGSIPPGNRNQGGPALYRRSANYVWHVEQGVPPIIEPVGDDVVILNQPSVDQEEAFKEWFAELAYPWRNSQSDQRNEPQVILRRVSA